MANLDISGQNEIIEQIMVIWSQSGLRQTNPGLMQAKYGQFRSIRANQDQYGHFKADFDDWRISKQGFFLVK